MDEYLQRYSRYVLWAIRYISRGRVHPDDVPDYVQMIHLRVLETRYLDRVATLIAERGTGCFSTYLFLLIRSVMVNSFKRNVRDPLNQACRIGVARSPKLRPDARTQTIYPEQDPVLAVKVYDRGFEDRMNFEVQLARFADYVETTQRGALTAQALALLCEGYTTREISEAEAVPSSRVVQARRDLRTHYRAFMRRVG